MATYRVVDEDGDYYEVEGDPGDALTETILRADDAEYERDRLRAERDQLRARLAAADTEQAEYAARIGELRTEWGCAVEDSDGAVVCDDERDARRAAARYSRLRTPGGKTFAYRAVRREVTEWRDAGAADADGDSPSATETRQEGAPVSVDANTSSITPARQTEGEPYVRPSYCRCAPLPEGPGDRDAKVWCWEPNPNGPLRCGLLANHDGPHRRGEREWRADAGQDTTKENET